MSDYTDCPNCGAPLEAAAESCPFCGTAAAEEVEPASRVALGPGPVASPARRLGARAIDLVIVIAIAFFGRAMAYAVGTLTHGPTGLSAGDLLVTAALYVFGSFGGLVYEAVLLAQRGQTVGKIALHIKVVDVDRGRKPSWQIAVLRTVVLAAGLLVAYLAPVLPWMFAGSWFTTMAVVAASIFFIVVVGMSVLFDPLRRGLHDRAARTIVIATEGPSDPAFSTPNALRGRLLG